MPAQNICEERSVRYNLGHYFALVLLYVIWTSLYYGHDSLSTEKASIVPN